MQRRSIIAPLTLVTNISLMKKLLTFLVLLIIPITAVANVEEDVWSYVFHLEYANGALSVRADIKTPYSPIPMLFTPVIDAAQAPFYGVVVSGKGKTLEKFGIPSATTINTVTGKSEMEVVGPYFANADHVAFYTKEGKHLLTVSVKGSSFCNDNNKCNADVGENYINCPLDCPAPAKTPVYNPITTPIPPTAPTISSTTQQPEQKVGPVNGAIDSSYVTANNPEVPVSGGWMSAKTILMIGAGILMIILGFVYFRIKRSME